MASLFPHLSTPADRQGQACPKPERRQRVKGRQQRAAAKVVRSVRAQCVERDGDCSVEMAFWGHRGVFGQLSDEAGDINGWEEGCEGSSQWAHLHSHRRSQTRGQAADKRHTTTGSLMLCKLHHDQYDGRATPRLKITCLSRKGADGPLRFSRMGVK